MKTIFTLLFALLSTGIYAQQQNTSDSTTTIIRDGRGPTPLYVLGRKIVSKEVIDTLKVETIERVDVLKGVSATQIYGEMGKNGAVLITLKNPKAISVKKSRRKKS